MRDRCPIHWWNGTLGRSIPAFLPCPVLTFQLPEQRKIGCLLLFGQAQLIPRKIISFADFSLNRPLGIGKCVFRIAVTRESQSVFQELHLSGER